MKHKLTVKYQHHSINYILTRKPVRRINIRVKPDCTVHVSANMSVPISYIEALLWQKGAWIIKNLEKFKQKQSALAKRRLISGEIISYLGQDYLLEVTESEAEERVSFKNGFVQLYVKPESTFEEREKLLGDWYKKEAAPVFSKALEKLFPLVKRQGFKKPAIKVRKMKTRWGSCSWKKGSITLNSELLKIPLVCIEYVIMHELAHFKHQGHDRQFYSYLDELMPGWQDYKRLLDAYRL